MQGTPWPLHLPSLISEGGRGRVSNIPFTALLPRLTYPGQEDMAAPQGMGCRMRPRVVQAQGGWQPLCWAHPVRLSGETEQQMQGRQQEWRLSLFWPWAL